MKNATISNRYYHDDALGANRIACHYPQHCTVVRIGREEIRSLISLEINSS
jgi:hypothetical protein